MQNDKRALEKIYFRLQQDDGYPPTPWESLWAKRIGDNLFEIDNIPFYAMDVSPEDRISTEIVDGKHEYRSTVSRSRNSVFRVYVYDESKIQTARDRFRRLGVESERGAGKLFAIEIPGNIDIGPVLDLLMQGQDSGEWDIEEGALRHTVDE